MLKSNEINVSDEQAIFPLVCFDQVQKKYVCVGTAFFIHAAGWFITAKHVICNNDKLEYEKIIGIQSYFSGLRVMREVTNLSIHPKADIVLGKLGVPRNIHGEVVEYEDAPSFILSFKKLEVNDRIITFGYPRTNRSDVGDQVTFHFTGKWSDGFVSEFCRDGGLLVRNICYRTSMFIDTGVSGGPVFKDNLVVGINSSGFDLEEGAEPISYITPIEYIRQLQAHINETEIEPVDYLIKYGLIQVKT